MINKKGQFFSLLVVLIIILFVIFFMNKVKLQEQDEQFRIERLQIVVMDNFVRDFDNYYMEQILRTAAKPAVAALITDGGIPFGRNEIEDVMKDGARGGNQIMTYPLSTNSNYEQVLRTITFGLESGSLFNYTLESVIQTDFDTIKLEFNVSYVLRTLDTEWSTTNLPVSVEMDIYSLGHPIYSGQIIDDSWVQDASGGCYIQLIIGNAETCSGKNIKPNTVIV